MAVKVSGESFEAEVLKCNVPVLVDFYSDDCVPCKRMSPVLAELEEECGDSFKLCKLNVYANMDITEKYEVFAAPTLILFDSGKEIERRFGFQSKESIQDILGKVLKAASVTLTVSGVKKEYAEGLTVAKLIELEKVETPEYVTVSVNGEFIASGVFAKTILKDGDDVEFLYFMGGGR